MTDNAAERRDSTVLIRPPRTRPLSACWPMAKGYDECCHNCRHHRPDHSHPLVDGGRVSERHGWVCLAPEFDGAVFSGWPFHGLCEMWQETNGRKP